nr:HupE/UreJ family protein [uncultured Marinobacter sp.]
MAGLKPIGLLLVAVTMALMASAAMAHKASDSFLYLNTGPTELRLDVALRDLALLVSLDRNGDRQVSGQELRQARPDITRVVEASLNLSNNSGDCSLAGQRWGISSHSDGTYAAARYRIHCPDGEPPTALEYNLLFDRDGLHRGLVSLGTDDEPRLAVLSPEARVLDLSPAGAGSRFSVFTTFVYEGIVHLLIGLDHILFLLVLVIPASLGTREGRAGHGSGADFRARLLELAGIVTAFTVAHSVTLALAALDIVTLPIAWVETVIALSIAVAALNVAWPVLGRKTWKLAFGFGLVHGFGFASVLGDLTSGLSGLMVALAGFNIGVELGQLGLLVLGFPILYLLGRHRVYQRGLVPMTLLAVGAISLYWVVQRAPVL